MRLVLFFILIGASWPLAAQPDLAQCAGIDSAVERLDCYDRLARDARPAEPDAPAEPAAPVPQVPEPGQPEAAPEPARQPEPLLAEPAARGPAAVPAAEEFGLPQRRQASAELESITAHIESVRKAPLGQHILTLSNGQVWVENEPGRRRIAAGQDVVIRKHRWHYEMELPDQPNVAVRRVD